jgi:hypothetical protein
VIALLLLSGPRLVDATPFGSVRVPFVANQGQTDPRVAYYATAAGGTLFVTRTGEVVHALPGMSLTETLVGGRARPAGQDRSPTGVSEFRGADRALWRAALPTYGAVSLGEVWPRVDVSLRRQGRGIEKVFTVQPGGRVDRIRVRVRGADALAVDAEGALVARTPAGPVTFTAPIAYQEHPDGRRTVDVAYRRQGREYGFTVGAYDRSRPLVIDPLVQSTYLGGGASDAAVAVAIHPATGEVYVAGRTSSSNFPGTAGGPQPAGGTAGDAFVARFDRALTTLVQATYLGGSGEDFAQALAIHPLTGDVYLAGEAASTDFPATAGGAQPMNAGTRDGFVARLDGTLTVLHQATYFGGTGFDRINALVVHPANGDVYAAGELLNSTSLPGTAGGFQPDPGGSNDGFVARFTSALTAVLQASFLGGSGGDSAHAIAVDPPTGDLFVAGQTLSTNFPATATGFQPTKRDATDAFVVRVNAALTSRIRATYVGGDGSDLTGALAVHPVNGDVYLAGETTSVNFPGTTGGAQPHNGGMTDGYVARFNGALTALVQATYLGGALEDGVNALAIQPATGDVYVAGGAESPDLPGTAGGAQDHKTGAPGDAFVARLNAALTALVQATYLGGNADDNALDLAIDRATADVYVVGSTESSDLPGTGGGAQPQNAGGGGDGFVARLTFGLAQVDPALGISASVNHPSFAVQETVSISGAIDDPGLPLSADFYIGLVRPDGSVEFFTGSGSVFGTVTDLASFHPLVTGVPLGTPVSVAAPGLYVHQRTPADLPGLYVLFIAAVKTGALAGGTLAADQILGVATASYSFP